MLKYTPFTQEDFDTYFELQNKDYAKDLTLVRDMTFDEALTYAKEEMKKFIPDGMNTKGHTFLNVENEGKHIGILWYLTKKKKRSTSVFLCHIYLYEEFRSFGFGKQMLTWLEEESKRLGANELSLHVFGHNKKAIHLYEKLGFSPWSIQMKKPLK